MRRLLLILPLALASARADVVRLKNGRTIEGKIIEENEQEVKLHTGSAQMTVSRSQIASIEHREAPLEAYARRAAELAEDDATGHFELAEFCLKHRLFSQALDELRRVLAIEPEHKVAAGKLRPLLERRAAPLLARAKRLQGKGEYEQAEKPLLTILEQYPEATNHAAAAHHHLAVGLAARRQYDKAFTRWRRALRLKADYAEALEGAAHAAIELGDWTQALSFTQRALELNKGGGPARLRERATTLRGLVELAKTAKSKSPGPARLAKEGRLLMRLGLGERGIARLEAAYDAGARDAELLKFLADHNERVGRVGRALELCKELVGLDPLNDDLVRRRSRLERLRLVPKALTTRNRRERERILFEIAKSGAPFKYVETVLRESTERAPQKTGIVEGSFVVDEALIGASYACYVPKSYEPRRPWPLILAFHRDDDSGKEHFYNWETVAETGRYILMFPDSPRRSRAWRFSDINLALSALRHAKKLYHIDTNRVFLGGTASGGLLAWAVALRHPDRFAGLIVRNAPIDEVTRLFLPAAVNLPIYQLASERASPDIITSLREADTALTRWSYPANREEVQGGHPALPELNTKVIAWLQDKVRDPYARRVRLISFDFSNARAFWVRIDRFARTVFDPDRKVEIRPPAGAEYSPEQIRMIYLGEMGKALGQAAAGVVPGNRINVVAKHVKELTVFLDDQMVNLDKPVRIYVNGKLAFRGRVERSLEHLFESARLHRDPRMCYAASVKLRVK